MKVSYLSNFFNYHQLPLAVTLYKLLGHDYTFISLCETEGVIGRTNLDREYPFILRAYESEECIKEAMKHAIDDDFVIFGDLCGKEQFVRARDATGKPFLRDSERILKRGDLWRFVPPKAYRTYNRYLRYRNSNMYTLCNGAYAARDLVTSGFP